MYLVQGVLWEGRDKEGRRTLFFSPQDDGPGTQQKQVAPCSFKSIISHSFWGCWECCSPVADLTFWWELPTPRNTISPRVQPAPSKRPQQNGSKGAVCLAISVISMGFPQGPGSLWGSSASAEHWFESVHPTSVLQGWSRGITSAQTVLEMQALRPCSGPALALSTS